jgi:hypothetical protein
MNRKFNPSSILTRALFATRRFGERRGGGSVLGLADHYNADLPWRAHRTQSWLSVVRYSPADWPAGRGAENARGAKLCPASCRAVERDESAVAQHAGVRNVGR